MLSPILQAARDILEGAGRKGLPTDEITRIAIEQNKNCGLDAEQFKAKLQAALLAAVPPWKWRKGTLWAINDKEQVHMSNEAKSLKVSKTINYYRVNFNETCPKTLEYYLRQAHDALPNVGQRRFALTEQELKGCHVKQPKEGGGYSHVTLVTPGEPATTVPDEENTTHVDLKDTPPPPKE